MHVKIVFCGYFIGVVLAFSSLFVIVEALNFVETYYQISDVVLLSSINNFLLFLFLTWLLLKSHKSEID